MGVESRPQARGLHRSGKLHTHASKRATLSLRLKKLLIVIAFAGVLAASAFVLKRKQLPTSSSGTITLRDVGPRYVSNQTAQPLALHGEGFVPGMQLELGAPWTRKLPVSTVDATLAYAKLPADLEVRADQLQAQVPLRLISPEGPGSEPLPLTVVNDRAFVDPAVMVMSARTQRLFIASGPTDTLFSVDLQSREVTPLRAGDGPSALALWTDARGAEWLVVAHQFAKELRLYSTADPSLAPGILAGPAYAAGIAIDDEASTAWIAEHVFDTVVAIDLSSGQERRRVEVSPNPRELAWIGDRLAVGSLQSGELQWIDPKTGEVTRTVAPDAKTAIIGGGTAEYDRYIMGGKAPRAFAYAKEAQRLFVASIGPNIGPNPARMEVSMNGGVGVIDLATGRFERHLGFGAGVTDALALDEARGLLYAADTSLGLVRVLELRRLLGSEADAATAVVRSLKISPPEGFPTVRPAQDFGVNRRAGIEVHSGPTALALDEASGALHVLARFTGQVHTFLPDGSERVLPLGEMLTQRTRRLGQILYYADIGQSAMSCDACHLEGHTEGVFFEKTRPLRIYRSNTVRGSRESPPYFTPASTRSLAETAQDVGGRNRFHNPVPTPEEIEALAQFSGAITLLPNPHLGPDGAPPQELALPEGRRGRPYQGRALFEARCRSCHPGPHYTTDQDPATRGQFLDVGTPHALPLRVEQQELLFTKFAPPPLVGSWDVFPMLGTGSAGLEVTAEGQLRTGTRHPLREVLERYSGPLHGDAAALSPEERDDLLAWLLTL